ncbi:MAG TPA: hypothetical protein VJ499_16250, partial [Flavisolibacter sp.]|nr:hypothetical protein [Flavisolibacter sp.]
SLIAVLFTAGVVMAQQQGKKLPPPPPPPPVPGVSLNAPPPPPPVAAQADLAVPPAPPSAPPVPPAPPIKAKKLSSGGYDAFIQRNPQVEGLSWSDEGKTLRVQLKDGTEETFNLDNKEEAAKAKLRYGKLPASPPPPPAPELPGNE